MSGIAMSDTELLKYAVENGIIDTALIQQKIAMREREELLKKHPYSIYQGNDGKWYSYLPDKTGRKKIKATLQSKIEDKVVEYWKQKELNPTVRDVFSYWIERKLSREEISRATYDRYKIDFDKYFVKIAEKRIQSIDEEFLDDFIGESIQEFSMTSKAFSNFRTLIYGIFKYAKKKKYVSFSITYVMGDIDISQKAFRHVVKKANEQVYMPKEKERMEEYLTENDDIMNLGLLFMFKTGVRVGELAALKREDVENYTVAINATETRFKDSDGNVHYDVKNFPKSEAGLRFAILPEQYEWILDKILKLNPNGYYLFEKNGHRIKTYSFRRRLRYICESKIYIKPKSPHKIRKTYGSILLDGKARESTVLNAMGHTDIKCTKGYYYFDRSDIEDKREELSMMPGL